MFRGVLRPGRSLKYRLGRQDTVWRKAPLRISQKLSNLPRPSPRHGTNPQSLDLHNRSQRSRFAACRCSPDKIGKSRGSLRITAMGATACAGRARDSRARRYIKARSCVRGAAARPTRTPKPRRLSACPSASPRHQDYNSRLHNRQCLTPRPRFQFLQTCFSGQRGLV